MLEQALLSLVYSIYTDFLAREIDTGPLPTHLAAILDGNRRYARYSGLEHPSLAMKLVLKRSRIFSPGA